MPDKRGACGNGAAGADAPCVALGEAAKPSDGVDDARAPARGRLHGRPFWGQGTRDLGPWSIFPAHRSPTRMASKDKPDPSAKRKCPSVGSPSRECSYAACPITSLQPVSPVPRLAAGVEVLRPAADPPRRPGTSAYGAGDAASQPRRRTPLAVELRGDTSFAHDVFSARHPRSQIRDLRKSPFS